MDNHKSKPLNRGRVRKVNVRGFTQHSYLIFCAPQPVVVSLYDDIRFAGPRQSHPVGSCSSNSFGSSYCCPKKPSHHTDESSPLQQQNEPSAELASTLIVAANLLKTRQLRQNDTAGACQRQHPSLQRRTTATLHKHFHKFRTACCDVITASHSYLTNVRQGH